MKPPLRADRGIKDKGDSCLRDDAIEEAANIPKIDLAPPDRINGRRLRLTWAGGNGRFVRTADSDLLVSEGPLSGARRSELNRFRPRRNRPYVAVNA